MLYIFIRCNTLVLSFFAILEALNLINYSIYLYNCFYIIISTINNIRSTIQGCECFLNDKRSIAFLNLSRANFRTSNEDNNIKKPFDYLNPFVDLSTQELNSTTSLVFKYSKQNLKQI